MNDPFAEALSRDLDVIHPGASAHLADIDALPEPVRSRVLDLLLGRACDSQHVGNITAAQEAIARIPKEWLSRNLKSAIVRVIDLADEWQYRRLIEVMATLKSELIGFYIDHGLMSNDASIQEAARDYQHLQGPQ
jgi:hypothetical protein